MSGRPPANRNLRLKTVAFALVMLAPWGLYLAAQAGNVAGMWICFGTLSAGMILALSIS